MRYALTGATGFVGGALAARLIAAGHSVRALVRSPDRAEGLRRLGVELVAGDLGDEASVAALCDGADGLFHVAGWYKLGSRTPEDAWLTNVDGTRSVLRIARRFEVRTVYTSTLAVNSDTKGRIVDEDHRFSGTHVSVYDETKAQAHAVAVEEASAGMDIVIVQPGLVYGPGDTSQGGELIAAVVAGGRPLLHEGGKACWGYIDDIAAGHVLAMEEGRSGRSYFLAGPPATLADGLRLAAQLAGTPGPRMLPVGVVRGTAALVRGVERIVPIYGTYASETLRASLATYLGDPGRAETELGWNARSLPDGMVATVAALRG